MYGPAKHNLNLSAASSFHSETRESEAPSSPCLKPLPPPMIPVVLPSGWLSFAERRRQSEPVRTLALFYVCSYGPTPGSGPKGEGPVGILTRPPVLPSGPMWPSGPPNF